MKWTLTFVFVCTFTAAASAQNSATITAPSSATGGTLVTVTGTSPSGENGTHISIEDENGNIEPESVTWIGTSFTLIYRQPPHDESEPDNAVSIIITPEAQYNGTSAEVRIDP